MSPTLYPAVQPTNQQPSIQRSEASVDPCIATNGCAASTNDGGAIFYVWADHENANLESDQPFPLEIATKLVTTGDALSGCQHSSAALESLFELVKCADGLEDEQMEYEENTSRPEVNWGERFTREIRNFVNSDPHTHPATSNKVMAYGSLDSVARAEVPWQRTHVHIVTNPHDLFGLEEEGYHLISNEQARELYDRTFCQCDGWRNPPQ
jgi:hypothetical protein